MRACAGTGDPEEESKQAAEQIFFEMRDMQRELKEAKVTHADMQAVIEQKNSEIESLKKQMEGLIREVKASLAKQKAKEKIGKASHSMKMREEEEREERAGSQRLRSSKAAGLPPSMAHRPLASRNANSKR